MDNIQILTIIDSVGRKLMPFHSFWIGVYTADMIPLPNDNNLRFPCCFIANTDPSGESGTHWVAFHYLSKDKIEFFDSFANHLGFYPILNKVLNYVKSISVVPFVLQSESSDLCGQYCILFILSCLKGNSLKKFISKHFSRSKNNDAYVNHLGCTYLSQCSHLISCPGNQKCICKNQCFN